MNEDTWEGILASNDASHNWVSHTLQSWFCFECEILKTGLYRASDVPHFEYKRRKGSVFYSIKSCDEEIIMAILDE